MLSFLFSFKGRIRLRDYWLFNLAIFALVCLMMAPELTAVSDVRSAGAVLDDGYDHFYRYLGRLVDRVLLLPDTAPDWLNVAFFLPVVACVAWIKLALAVKRWHDRDKSGFMVLIVIIPVVGWIWAFVETLLLQGSPGENSYGSDPKGVSADVAPVPLNA